MPFGYRNDYGTGLNLVPFVSVPVDTPVDTVIFADVPGPRTMIGGAVIVGCGCYIILRERRN